MKQIQTKVRGNRRAQATEAISQAIEHCSGFYLPVLWMALGVSVLATLLLYRLIARGNLVNVTSLFYLVLAVTAVMDYLIVGNTLAVLSLLGMGLIIIGLMSVFRKN